MSLDAAVDLGPVDALLAWGEGQRRDLPWRRTRDPWAVLVSEVMLQQTQVARVVPRYEAFLARFPDVATCAAAPVAEVIDRWAGLGYNRRAVNLHRTATAVVGDHGGVFPRDLASLLALPGVGPYTARAVLVFAFEDDVGVVDTNVGRVLARWNGGRMTARQVQDRADRLVPTGRAWAWNQALFDLGAAVCTRRSPACDRCPVLSSCRWHGAGCPDPDPADGSAGVSGRQSPFEGSDRQGRGRLVDALRAAGRVPGPTLAARAGWPDGEARARAVAATLVADGLAEWDGDDLVRP